MEDEVDLKLQLDEAERALNPAERELWQAIKDFVDGQVAAGVASDSAYDMARNLLRRASNLKASQRRATFKVVDPGRESPSK